MHSWFSVPHSQQFGNVVGVGPNLIGTQALQVLALAVENAHVRTEKLVGRADQKIAVERAHVNRTVRSVVDGIDVTQGSGLPRQAHHFGDVVDRAHGI
jgi:hypothetical protein